MYGLLITSHSGQCRQTKFLGNPPSTCQCTLSGSFIFPLCLCVGGVNTRPPCVLESVWDGVTGSCSCHCNTPLAVQAIPKFQEALARRSTHADCGPAPERPMFCFGQSRERVQYKWLFSSSCRMLSISVARNQHCILANESTKWSALEHWQKCKDARKPCTRAKNSK